MGFTRNEVVLTRAYKSSFERKIMMGYIPPEEDPEYRPMIKSLLKPMGGDESVGL